MDALLVKRAQREDVGAFVELMEKYKTALYKVAKSYLGSEDDIADVMQDTVLAAYEHIKELKNASYFKTWLTRILINQCKDFLRQQKKYVVSDKIAETPYEMPENNRTNEIAQILDVNENTVKSRLRRGRDRLKQVLCY